jgi:hypothetical protein
MTNHSTLRFGKELKDLQLSDVQFLIDEKIDESQNLEYKQPSTEPKNDYNMKRSLKKEEN